MIFLKLNLIYFTSSENAALGYTKLQLRSLILHSVFTPNYVSLSMDFTGISHEQGNARSAASELELRDPAVMVKDVLVSPGKVGKG